MGFTRVPTGCLVQKSLVVGHLQPEGDRGPGEASQPQSPRVSHTMHTPAQSSCGHSSQGAEVA